ncbi:MAG: hypothetical protein H7096_09310 [Flavobacterium sp.]|nr:hypothetical protein [Pedobacter sp.]
MKKRARRLLPKRKIEILVPNLNISRNSTESINLASPNSYVQNFEDGQEYYAAIENGCTCIITKNLNDFNFSERKF